MCEIICHNHDISTNCYKTGAITNVGKETILKINLT
jgi:hypothetical protein